jgi:nucleotide-binding universal stress UspA family protein
MPGIVCAVRGGPASQRTITRAIALAQETGLPLCFLYVVNLDFLSQTSTSRVHTISQEMHEMGEFILLMAQEMSARKGITAEGVVRHGSVSSEVIGLCQELLSKFVALTEEQTGATVVFPEADVL